MKQKEIFFRKGVEVLLYINGELNISSISFAIHLTYSHVHKLINIFKKEGIISTEIIGKNRIITLTKKGVNLQNLFREINNKLKQNRGV